MKLAEALLLRSDLQTKLTSLQQRINNNVLIQEGDELSEDPKEFIHFSYIKRLTIYKVLCL
jgi:hypothetical protein